jgi:hypothetical protein
LVFRYDLAVFVDGFLSLDVKRSKVYSWELSNFVERKRESETSNDIICHQLSE